MCTHTSTLATSDDHTSAHSCTTDHHHPDETPEPSHWLSAGAMALTGCGLLAVTALLVLCYLLATTAGAVGPGRALLLGATVATGSVAGMTLIAGWTVRVQDARRVRHLAELRADLDQTAAAMACTASRLRVALDELPEQIRDRVAAQGKAVLAVTDGIERQQAEVLIAVRELGERMEGRVAAIEQRVDEQDEEYERGWLDGAAKVAETVPGNGHGTVRQLHSPPPRRR